jgi:UDP-sulfoquinovose synthase
VPLPRSYEVAILDSLVRRAMDAELGFDTLTPIQSIHTRLAAWKSITGKTIPLFVGDVTCVGGAARGRGAPVLTWQCALRLRSDYEFLSAAFTEFAPTAAVHFGEQRRHAQPRPRPRAALRCRTPRQPLTHAPRRSPLRAPPHSL